MQRTVRARAACFAGYLFAVHLAAGCLLAISSGCGASAGPLSALAGLPVADVAAPTAENDAAIDPTLARRLLEIAEEYADYELVNTDSRIANGACFVPSGEFVPPQFSQADGAGHGKKLYFLFARDADAYAAAGADAMQPVGQVVVKESWAAREIRDSHQPSRFEHRGGMPIRLYAEQEGRAYGADRQTELFIMFKQPPDAAGTDAGWVYGTVTADRQRVTSAGRIASCVDCHRQAPGDRLFGSRSPE